MINKRGLSNVIVTLIIIVISLIAVGLVWVVVQNLIEGETDEISLGFVTVDLEIKDVKVQGNNTEVKVKRKIGEGEISGLKFIVSDGVNTEVIDKKNVNMSQLEEKTFILTSAELGNIVLIKEISVAPIFKLGSGEEKIGNVVDKFEFTNEKVLQDIGAVSWWRFEGNAQDEISGNHGVIYGNTTQTNTGKFGNAFYFDGNGDYVDSGNGNSLKIVDTITIGAWIKTNADMNYCGLNGNYGVMAKANATLPSGGTVWSWQLRFGAPDACNLGFQFNKNVGSTWVNVGQNLTQGEWYHVFGVFNGTTARSYLNGVKIQEISFPAGSLKDTNSPLVIAQEGWENFFDGTIDEVMIFNRALTDKQVEALYEMDFS